MSWQVRVEGLVQERGERGRCARETAKLATGLSYHIRASRYVVGLVLLGGVESGRAQPRMQTVAGGRAEGVGLIEVVPGRCLIK